MSTAFSGRTRPLWPLVAATSFLSISLSFSLREREPPGCPLGDFFLPPVLSSRCVPHFSRLENRLVLIRAGPTPRVSGCCFSVFFWSLRRDDGMLFCVPDVLFPFFPTECSFVGLTCDAPSNFSRKRSFFLEGATFNEHNFFSCSLTRKLSSPPSDSPGGKVA